MNRSEMLQKLRNEVRAWFVGECNLMGDWKVMKDFDTHDFVVCHTMHDPITRADWQPSIEARVLAAKVGAADVLTAGAKHLSDRAVTYDSVEGERSMSATVDAFKNITGHSLTEEQGWLFMVLLKAVRSQQGNYKLDNYEDGAAYFALMAESASEVRK